jgi:DNA polymerase III alpha subunit
LWYKYYYPKYFYAALLNNDPDRIQETIFDILQDGMEVGKPDINKSDVFKFVADDKEDKIYMPLNVKHVGDACLKEISLTRPYSSAQELMKRVSKRAFPSRARASLFLCGAFKSLTDDYKDLDLEYKDLLYLNKTNDLLKIIKKVFDKDKIELFFRYLTAETDEIEFVQEKITEISNVVLTDFELFFVPR